MSLTAPMHGPYTIQQATVKTTLEAIQAIRCVAAEARLSAALRRKYLCAVQQILSQSEDQLTGLDITPPCVGEKMADITYDIHRTACLED